MTLRGLDQARFPLTALAVKLRIGVAMFVGVVAFVPSLVMCVVSRADVTWIVLLQATIPAALWLLAWRSGSARSVRLPLSLALFMATVVLIPVPDGFAWPRLAGIALSLAVTAAVVASPRWTFVWSSYAVILLAVDYLRDSPHAGHISSSPLDATSTFLGLVLLPPAIAMVTAQWSRSCELTDANSESLRLRAKRARLAETAEAARSAVDRQIHETVLNTLTTIARARTSGEGMRTQCAEDLRALDALGTAAPRQVRDLLAQALERNPVAAPTVTEVTGGITFRDDTMANVALAALSEALRNVSRHARASLTQIQVRATRDHVTFTIADDGVGMDDTTRQRFGMRRALTETVESSGGSVDVTSTPGRGTIVTISLPLGRELSAQPIVNISSLDILMHPPVVRAGMTVAIALGLVLLVPTAQVFAQPALVAASYLVFASLVILIAVRWESRGIESLAWMSLFAFIASQAIAWWGVQGCVSAGGLHGVLFTTTGAMVLPLLAVRRRLPTAIMLVIVVSCTVAIPWVLPTGCLAEALVPAIETSLWVVALVGVTTTLSWAFDRSRAALAARWDEIEDADAHLVAMRAADQRWRSVDAQTRHLLVSVAEGTCSADDPQVRLSATRLEARLRSLLETSMIHSSDLRTCLEEVVHRVTGAGVPVNVLVVSGGTAGAVDPALPSLLLDIGTRSPQSGLQITVADRELLISAQRGALEASGLRDISETNDPDFAVAVVQWDREPSSV